MSQSRDIFGWIFPGGELKTILTAITLVNNTAKNTLETVPAGERWLLLGTRLVNCDDVNRDVAIYVKDVDDNLVHKLIGHAALVPTAYVQWPNRIPNVYDQHQAWWPVLLDPGDYIDFRHEAGGASAGGTDADGGITRVLRAWLF